MQDFSKDDIVIDRLDTESKRMAAGALQQTRAFAECNCTQQRRLCTRQSLCRVLHSAKSCRHILSRQRISRVPRRHSTKKSRRDGQVTVTAPLPSATRRHSAKKCVFLYFFKKMLCRVPASGTRQSLFSFFLDFISRVL